MADAFEAFNRVGVGQGRDFPLSIEPCSLQLIDVANGGIENKANFAMIIPHIVNHGYPGHLKIGCKV